MTYPGGKGGAGVYQAIINQLPPHSVYVEPFAGHGAILRHKRPAPSTIAIDIDEAVVVFWRHHASVDFHHGCGIEWLQDGGFTLPPTALVYADPPYLWEARRSQRAIYNHELGDIDHVVLIDVLKRLPCMVAISGYRSKLYTKQLEGDGWRLETFTGQTRGGPAEECLWMNYPEPAALHDYRFLGSDYRERERIKRKVTRWRGKFDRLPDLERQAIASALLEHRQEERTVPAPSVIDGEATADQWLATFGGNGIAHRRKRRRQLEAEQVPPS